MTPPRPFYLVVREAVPGDPTTRHILRGYNKPAPAKAMRTRSVDVPLKILIVDPALCVELDSDPQEQYELWERAIETVGLQADASKKRVLANEKVKPRKRSKIVCRADGCRSGTVWELGPWDGRTRTRTPIPCTTCGGTGRVPGG
jgi:hypothetical protein